MAQSGIQVKPDPDDLESRLLSLCLQFPNGLSQQIIRAHLPDVPIKTLIPVLNSLAQCGRLEVLQTANKELLWKIRDQTADDKLAGLDQKDIMVYEQLKSFGNKGTWVQTLRTRTTLPLKEVNKCLKVLETRKLIKVVRPAGQPKKKVYMLAELEPHESLLGGTFFSGEGFDQEFVDILTQQCSVFLLKRAQSAAATDLDPMGKVNASFVTPDDMLEFINTSNLTNVRLAETDVCTLLDCLVAEALAESRPNATGQVCYRAARLLLSPGSGPICVPCVICPVSSDCRLGGDISPTTCPYIHDWLTKF